MKQKKYRQTNFLIDLNQKLLESQLGSGTPMEKKLLQKLESIKISRDQPPKLQFISNDELEQLNNKYHNNFKNYLKSLASEPYTKRHDPLALVSTLKLFGQPDDLKYFTHAWDQNLEKLESYRKFIAESQQSIDKLKRINFLNTPFYQNVIYPFIIDNSIETKKDQWGIKKIKIGWRSPIAFWQHHLDEQGPRNLGLKNIKPEERIRFFGSNEKESISKFIHVIEYFKTLIEFRDKTLKFEIENLIKEYQDDFKFDLNIENRPFYTSTFQVLGAIKKILGNITSGQRAIHKEVCIIGKVTSQNEYQLDISHIGSYPETSPNSEKLMLTKAAGDFYEIRNLLLSLCKWSVRSRFLVNGQIDNYELTYLGEAKQDAFVQRVNTDIPKGFTHRLSFPL